MGFGNFGQFLAKRFVKQGHRVRLRRCAAHPQTRPTLPPSSWHPGARSRARPRRQVIATSRTDYAAAASSVGVTFFGDADDFVEEVRPVHRVPCVAVSV